VVAGPDKTVGKAALFLASLLTGALLALIGQTYQTGADTFELFAWWALLILPWALAGRTAVLWVLVAALANLAVAFYFAAFRRFLFFFGSDASMVWALASLNAVVLVLWEFAASVGISWMRERWSRRIVAAASGLAVTLLAVWTVVEPSDVGPLGIPAYVIWLGAAYVWYRHKARDLFVLSGGVMSLIVFVATLLTDKLLGRSGRVGASAFLFIGFVVIAMSATGAWWLRRIAAERRKEGGE
jgi:uncharacterized membrane protein